MILKENMENMNPESLLLKAHALGEDIKEMESIDVLHAYHRTQMKMKANRRQQVYSLIMRCAAFLTLPLLMTSLVLGYLYFHEPELDEKYADLFVTEPVGNSE